MNRTYTQTRNKRTTCTGWSAWSAWSSEWKGPPTYRAWRFRTRKCTKRWQQRTNRETCRRIPSIPFTQYWGSTWTIGAWANRSRSWTETQWESDWWEPPDHLPEWQMCIAPNVIRGDLFRAQLTWLKTLPEVRSYRAFLDGDKYKHGQVIRSEFLRPGTHVLRVEVDLKDGKSRDFEVSFNVINRLEMRIQDPVQPVSVGKGTASNGCTFKVAITNNSQDEMPVALEPISVPGGWKAGFKGDGVIVLPPHGSKTVSLVVELMNELGITEESLVPVTIGAVVDVNYSPKAGWSMNHAAFSTCYVKLTSKLDPETTRRIKRTNKALVRQDRDKVFQRSSRTRRP